MRVDLEFLDVQFDARGWTPPSGTGRSDHFTVAGSSVFGTVVSAPLVALGTTLVMVFTRAHASCSSSSKGSWD